MCLHKLIKASAISIIGMAAFAASATALAYSDVPPEHWASETIDRITETGIMQGRGNDEFGLGQSVTRGEFAAMLLRLMGWEEGDDNSPAFSDTAAGMWYTGEAAALAEHGIVSGDSFRPDDNITRSEMAVMLIKALGYDNIAEGITDSTFSDVTSDIGYIEAARDFGIINGKSDSVFDPNGTALREESAAMMMRLYDKYYSRLSDIHGFYAISSWSQRDTAAQMDSVSFGWGTLEFTDGGSVNLNTSSDGGNSWYIPEGYGDAVSYLDQNGVSENFAVTMTDQEDCRAILTVPENRTEAVRLLAEISSGYDGITIDFEGMKGDELRSGLNEFIKELRTALGEKTLFVAVHPVLKNSSEYYDAYDYRTLGEYADSVILMAHDYAAYTMPDSLLNTDFISTPVTPFDEVYHALKCITDPLTGVADTSKIKLALSLSSTAAWETENGMISNPQSIHPAMETVVSRLSQTDTEINYSDTYRNPYAWYSTEDGKRILIWYEDSRSVKDKIELARMFGINSISIWRIGEITNAGADIYMDIWDTILSEK